jgi:hypothetical protein
MIEKLIEEAEARVEETRREIDSGLYATNAAKLSELCEVLAVRELEVERLYLRWQELENLSRSDS